MCANESSLLAVALASEIKRVGDELTIDGPLRECLLLVLLTL